MDVAQGDVVAVAELHRGRERALGHRVLVRRLHVRQGGALVNVLGHLEEVQAMDAEGRVFDEALC